MSEKASIIIRTYNEERFIGDVLEGIKSQDLDDIAIEIIIVDSESSDRTREIAESYGCRIVNISKSEFTFGRSLNIGCSAANGNYLVILSGHCVPADNKWLVNLVKPIQNNQCVYSYGRQIGNDHNKFSERQLFKKFYPEYSQIPQQGYFCNNANSALKYDVWEVNHFNEELTGLEDMELSKRLDNRGYDLGYVAEAPVYHIHDETWRSVRNRYEREAIALQGIMPEVHVNFKDFLRYFTSGVLLDISAALEQRVLRKKFTEIIMFRFMQFWGSYRGNKEVRKLSHAQKEKYFFPK
ncbi:MAG: glycosyltransferase [Candidatus Thiodiazotropha sp.]